MSSPRSHFYLRIMSQLFKKAFFLFPRDFYDERAFELLGENSLDHEAELLVWYSDL